MDGTEHRDIGDAASGGALVNLGGESAEERFWLGYGDVMALSGDYFKPEPSLASRDHTQPDADALGTSTLFSLARVPGKGGTQTDTRDEIVCALRVMTLDKALVDPRFEPGGEFADFRFSPQASSSDVERRVRDRHLELAATNDDHFVAPGGVTHEYHPGPRPFGSAVLAYRHLHQLALEEACRLGRLGGDQSQAMAREAAAQHFLTDAFTAGHLRTPVAQIRRFWLSRYPAFWENMQHKVAADTASTLRELAWALRRLLPARFVHDSTLSALKKRTGRYPELSLGDFLARLFHDWDNTHGLTIDGGGMLFGDGHVDRGVTRQLATAAVRAGIDDTQVAFELGASGSRLSGKPLYRAVRAATGARETFLAETKVPRPSAANPPQNWRATDIETLWDAPMVGAAGTTVGEAVADMMQPGGYFIRQLDRLGQGLVEAYGLLALPILGGWLAHRGRQAYTRGFVDALAAEPKQTILSIVYEDATAETRKGSAPRVSGHAERRGKRRAGAA